MPTWPWLSKQLNARKHSFKAAGWRRYQNSDDHIHPYAAFSFDEGATEVTCTDDAPLTIGDMHHVAVVVDTQNQTFTLFLDGSLSCAIALTAPLSDLQDVNCWIGRSQYATDAGFAGSIDEFRIYDIPFTQRQVAFSFAAGPNPAWLDE